MIWSSESSYRTKSTRVVYHCRVRTVHVVSDFWQDSVDHPQKGLLVALSFRRISTTWDIPYSLKINVWSKWVLSPPVWHLRAFFLFFHSTASTKDLSQRSSRGFTVKAAWAASHDLEALLQWFQRWQQSYRSSSSPFCAVVAAAEFTPARIS